MRNAAALLLLVPLAYRAAAQSSIVQPATYRSPSGALELAVDPTDRKGAGPASYRLEREGAIVWEREHPFTLLEALVRDDGRVAGYAVTGGIRGFGELVIVVLGTDGAVAGEERVLRRASLAMHGPHEPHVVGLRDAGEGFALQIFDRPSSWWIHRWSDAGFERAEERASLRDPPVVGGGRPSERVHVAPAAAVDELPELAVSARTVALDWPVPITPETARDHDLRPRTPRLFLVDHARRAWVSEFSTHVNHAFDRAGRRLATCTPLADDFRPHRPGSWIAVRGDGHVFVPGDDTVVEFTADGARVGRIVVEDLPAWSFQPGSHARWEVAWSSVALVDAEGRVRERSERGADRRWLRWLYRSCASPDGGLVALDEFVTGDERDPTGPWLHVFSPDGAPRLSFQAPSGRAYRNLACDGERIALLAENDVTLVSVDGGFPGRVILPADGHDWGGLAWADGELWLLDTARAELRALWIGSR